MNQWFRPFLLPPKEEIEELVEKMKAFHEKYIKQLTVKSSR
jgi:hypothetical protein